MKPTYKKSWARNLLMWSDLTLGPFFKVKRGQPNIKVLITCLLLVLKVCSLKLTHWKAWAGNLLMWSDLTLGLSFKVKQGQPNLKVLITCLLLVLQVGNIKLTYRKSWPVNLLMWTDLTLVTSFKVKQWSTGSGELSFRWIQILIGSPMCRFSFSVLLFSHSDLKNIHFN